MATSSKADLLSVHRIAAGPKLAFHAGCVIDSCLYVHGGIDKAGDTAPQNGMHRLDVQAGVWSTLGSSQSPTLSHHCAVVLHNRYIVLIGGWNGKARVSEVFVYDTRDNIWQFPQCSGFPSGAGLSSHTATVLSSGDILVIGREGSLRTQRRSGNAFLLKGDITAKQFKYTEHPLAVASRSGHTTHITGNTLLVYGGRSDKVVEIHGGYKTKPTDVQHTVVDKLKNSLNDLAPLSKAPCGRKHHVSVSGAECLFIHGGETFDGRSREPVAEMFLLTLKPHMKWYKVGRTEFGRAGHVCGIHGDNIVIHGGVGAKNSVFVDTFLINLETT